MKLVESYLITTNKNNECMKETTITCDICGKPSNVQNNKIEVYERQGNVGHPYLYNDVCDNCLEAISIYIRQKLRQPKGKYEDAQ